MVVRTSNFNRPLRGCRFRRFRALAAEVVLVGRVFLQAVVEGMAHLRALRAYKINPLDGLVDSFAVENPAPQLLHPDSQQFLVLSLYLASARFVLGQIRIFIAFFATVDKPRIEIALR